MVFEYGKYNLYKFDKNDGMSELIQIIKSEKEANEVVESLIIDSITPFDIIR